MPANDNLDAEFGRVVEIMRRLRAPGGCPWDQKQTFDSIRTHTIEETYEVLEAIADRDYRAMREELGDLLLQVLFYAEMADEQHHFDIGDVVRELGDKLVRRHPHVFERDENAAALNPEQALARWNQMKAAEKPASAERASLLAGIPKHLPALAEAAKMGARASGVGFDWPGAAGVLAKIDEERDEIQAAIAAGDREQCEEEIGDLLFTVANLARHLQVEPESALKSANRKFQRRFEKMEAAHGGGDLSTLTPEAWDNLWEQAKQS
ncbi:MAG TPA: nucleoside triphosphate pyrophosphohydrolase [Terriglobales bacterium]|nr:nucleoside triphosphate pyrophosphohydrolase [Terriglobales bacterium]